MKKYFVGTQAEITTALNKIDSNCGFPNANAQRWAEAKPTANDGEYYAEAPIDGYNGFTAEQMLSGVNLSPVDSVELPIVENV